MKPKGVKIRVPEADELKPNARSTSLHPGTRLANVVAGVQFVQPFRDGAPSGTEVGTKRAGGKAKRTDSTATGIVPSVNPDMQNRVREH